MRLHLVNEVCVYGLLKLSVFLEIVDSELLILPSTLLRSITFDGKKRSSNNLALQIAFGNFRT